MAKSSLYSVDRDAILAVFEEWSEELGGQVADFTVKCGPNLLASHFWLTLQDIMEERTAAELKTQAETEAFMEEVQTFRDSFGTEPMKKILEGARPRAIPAEARPAILAAMAAYEVPATQGEQDDQPMIVHPKKLHPKKSFVPPAESDEPYDGQVQPQIDDDFA